MGERKLPHGARERVDEFAEMGADYLSRERPEAKDARDKFTCSECGMNRLNYQQWGRDSELLKQLLDFGLMDGTRQVLLDAVEKWREEQEHE